MSSVVEVKNISKSFKLRTAQSQTGTLRDEIGNILKKSWRGIPSARKDTFFALQDINFNIEQGDTLGIVGKNGAGKSTLLKILSRITRPSKGKIILRGRVGSLLEVGTGFHQELSGRENIFLNGAVLGMKRQEIKQKFDEIVEFAEVEKFLDTPVKFYSSGMYMRLAFAVAAHLEPEILIVDEVLAVGDAAFQKKCLGKMNEVAEGGRTVIFVSHSTAALHRLCKKAVYLERGKLKEIGEINAVLAKYHSDVIESNSAAANDRKSPADVKEGDIRFLDWRVKDSATNSGDTVYSREKISIELNFVSKRKTIGAHFKLSILDDNNQSVIIAHNLLGGCRETELKEGTYKISFKLHLPLKAGNYTILAEIYSAFGEGVFDLWESATPLTVLPVLEYEFPDDFQGLVNTPVEFEIKKGTL